MQVSGSLVEVDILELLRFPCPGVGICHASIGLGLIMVKELDQKLTLGMDEMKKLSLHLERNYRKGVSGSNLGQTQSHTLLESGCLLSNRSQHWLDIART